MLLQNLSWTGAEEAFKKTDFVILPTGSCEEHGPHMPLGTDFLVAGEIARRVGEKTGAIVAPTVPYGHCPWHMDFPGTVSIDQDVLYGYYLQICEALVKWGARRFMFINGHGGNTPSLDRVSMKLRSRGVVCCVVDWWVLAGSLNPEWIERGHGGLPETSAVLALFPGLVDMSAAKPATLKSYTPGLETQSINKFGFRNVPVKIWMRTRDVVEVGNFGDDPRLATPEIGNKEIDAVVEFLSALAGELSKIDLKADPA